jgi:WbqC-like protein family
MSKKMVITQSNYIPWKGYFDGMAMVDEFMLYDDMQYTKRDWRNRNQIKTPQGSVWLSVPVEVSGKYFQKIKDTKVSDKSWNTQHWNMLKQNYAKAACYNEVKDFLEPLYAAANFDYLSEVNFHFLQNIANYLGIATVITWSSDYELVEGKTEKLLDLCLKKNATAYYSGAAAKNYMDVELFEKAGVQVHWFDYSGYAEYPQLNPPFTHAVSIIDLLFNTGTKAKEWMKAVK